MKRTNELVVIAVVVLLSTCFFGQSAAPAHQQRPMMVDDLFYWQQLGDAKLSPDGQLLAYVLFRPAASETPRNHQLAFGLSRADVWLVAAKGGRSRNLTNGAANGGGYWNPVWSPNGQRLAMLSNRGGNIQVWIWEKATGQLKRIAAVGVDKVLQPISWISNEELACILLRENGRAIHNVIIRSTARMRFLSAKTMEGLEPSAGVVESGVPETLQGSDHLSQNMMVLVNVVDGRQRVIAHGAFVAGPSLSPDRRYLAMLRVIKASARPDPNGRVTKDQMESVVYQLVICSIGGRTLFESAPFAARSIRDLFYGLRPRWAPSGKQLALSASSRTAGKWFPHLYKYRVDNNVIEEVAKGEFTQIADLTWSSGGRLLISAVRQESSAEPNDENGLHWWILEPGGRYRNLTAGGKSGPRELFEETIGESFVGLADGKLWRIRIDGSPPQNLTATFVPRIKRIDAPGSFTQGRFRQIIFSVDNDLETVYYGIDLSSLRISALPKMGSEAQLLDFSMNSGVAIFMADRRDGSYVLSAAVDDVMPHTLRKCNMFLRELAEAGRRQIAYRSLDGHELKAWLVLPLGYQQDKRYPMIAYVYAGTDFSAGEPPNETRIDNPSYLNLQLLAARGYAILMPSMPLGSRNEPYFELANGVLPAVDKVIEMGIGDPRRIGVMGHSYGGYSVYGLITQTSRFRAAVAMSGYTDLLSSYGTFNAELRYDDFPLNTDYSFYYFEDGQGRMGGPPWKDLQHYIRNSPISYVERVTTPLLIIHGDVDFVPIQQGEEFFSALYRQNKRAKFVRYWGEGHDLQSPANIRDLWHRIVAWLDECLNVSRDKRGNVIWEGP